MRSGLVTAKESMRFPWAFFLLEVEIRNLYDLIWKVDIHDTGRFTKTDGKTMD